MACVEPKATPQWDFNNSFRRRPDVRPDSEGGLRALIRGLREEAAHPARQGALYIVPTDYEALRRKGTHSMILERDEDGFFDRVVTFHPMNAAWNVHRVAPSNTVYEFGKSVLPGLGRWRLARAIQFPLHLLFIVSASVYLARKGIVGLIRATDPCCVGSPRVGGSDPVRPSLLRFDPLRLRQVLSIRSSAERPADVRRRRESGA